MMKKIVLIPIVFLFVSLFCDGQAPHAFKYQAVIRDTTGAVISNHLVSLRVSVLRGDISGEVSYSEIHNVTTNALGLVNLEIGRGLVVQGDFDLISWGADNYFIQIEIDMEGTTNYQMLGTSQLLAVPYALYAEKSGTGLDTIVSQWKESAEGIYYDEGNVGINQADPQYNLDMNGVLNVNGEGRISNKLKVGLNNFNVTSEGKVGIGTENPDSKLQIEGETSGASPERNFLWLKNNSTDYLSNVYMTLSSGGESSTTLHHMGDYYSYNDVWQRYALLWNHGRGIILRTSIPGIIHFEFNEGSIVHETARFTSDGRMGIGTSTPESSAIIDMSSTTRGFLPPRMTLAELLAISNPAIGLIAYCLDCGLNGAGAIVLYEAGSWKTLCLNDCLAPPSAPIEGIHIPFSTQIIWNWSAVAGATGYKWNTINDYSSAEDMGTVISKTENGLTNNTSYTRYVWAYNSCGNSGALILSSTTLAPFQCGNIVNYEGRQYNTLQIGSQCWFQENLNVGVLIDVNQDPLNNSIIEKYCYNNLESSCDVYGGLYEWNELMNYSTQESAQGICPPGFHIPTNSEFCTLATYIDASVNCNTIGWSGIDCGTKMKSTSGWNSGGNGTNTSGYTSLPGGSCNNVNFINLGNCAAFFTSTMSETPGYFWYWSNFYNQTGMGHDKVISTACSVRCIADY